MTLILNIESSRVLISLLNLSYHIINKRVNVINPIPSPPFFTIGSSPLCLLRPFTRTAQYPLPVAKYECFAAVIVSAITSVFLTASLPLPVSRPPLCPSPTIIGLVVQTKSPRVSESADLSTCGVEPSPDTQR